MSAVNFTLKPEKTTKLYLDNSFALKKRFNYVYVDLESAFTAIRQAEPKVSLDKFERYLKSCNNDGHCLQESYYDSAKTQLMSKCIVDKNGHKDGPSLHYSEDGQSVTYGWYRKGKPHGKWMKKSKNGVISSFSMIYDRSGQKISPDTSVYDGKLNKFWYNAKTDEMKQILENGEPTAAYKAIISERISKMKEEGRSGAVKIDEKLADIRAKINHSNSEQSNTAAKPQVKIQPRLKAAIKSDFLEK